MPVPRKLWLMLGPDSARIAQILPPEGRPPGSNSGASVKGVVLGQGDCLLDESKVVVEQFVGQGTGGERRSAIDRRHRNLYGDEGASHIGSVLGEGHRRGSSR